MATVCITSAEAGAGKTAVIAGLGQHLSSEGKKVGYLKPFLTAGNEAAPAEFCRDAGFIKQALNLPEPVETLCPSVKMDSLASALSAALARVGSGKDVVLLESPDIASAKNTAEALNARVIVVEGTRELNYPGLEGRVLGKIRTKVPRRQASRMSVQDALLGVLPEDRLLYTITVAELARCLDGELVNAGKQEGELIGNFMVGAMTVDPGPSYYGRKAGKAVLIRGDRPDMQLAALETPLKCLVLCGGAAPVSAVDFRAREKKVPFILTKSNIAAAIDRIEEALAGERFHQEKKLPVLAGLMQGFNFPALYKGLGLAG